MTAIFDFHGRRDDTTGSRGGEVLVVGGREDRELPLA